MNWLFRLFKRNPKYVPLTEEQQRFLNGHVEKIHSAINPANYIRVVRPTPRGVSPDTDPCKVDYTFPEYPAILSTPTDFSFDTPSYDSGTSYDSPSDTDMGGGDFGGGGASSDF
jgi:uncharacterized membrane protein YgcG